MYIPFNCTLESIDCFFLELSVSGSNFYITLKVSDSRNSKLLSSVNGNDHQCFRNINFPLTRTSHFWIEITKRSSSQIVNVNKITFTLVFSKSLL